MPTTLPKDQLHCTTRMELNMAAHVWNSTWLHTYGTQHGCNICCKVYVCPKDCRERTKLLLPMSPHSQLRHFPPNTTTSPWLLAKRSRKACHPSQIHPDIAIAPDLSHSYGLPEPRLPESRIYCVLLPVTQIYMAVASNPKHPQGH